jgi:hypothetical protein
VNVLLFLGCYKFLVTLPRIAPLDSFQHLYSFSISV